MNDTKRRQLQLAVESTAAQWAAFVELKKEDWALGDSFGLESAVRQQLVELFRRKKYRSWIEQGAPVHKPRTRRSADVRERLDCGCLYLFSDSGPEIRLLVGARDSLKANGRRFFQALAFSVPSHRAGSPNGSYGQDEYPESFFRLMEQVGSPDVAELDLETVVQRSADRARLLLGAQGVAMGLLDTRNQMLRVLHVEIDGERREPFALEAHEGFFGRVLTEERSLLLDDPESNEVIPGEGPAPAVGVPLTYKGQLIGVLAVFGRQGGSAFSEQDARLLSLLAPNISISIRNARLFRELGERIRAHKITEKKIAEAARLTAIGEMAASVAHELNNPLTTITGFTELVLEDTGPEFRQRGDLELVLQEARRAREVVRRLLDFSRHGEEGSLPVDINEAVSEIVALVQSIAQAQRVELQFELWEDLPPVLGDHNQIKQVLLNLVNNGIYAMPSGGKLVIQTLSENRVAESWVRIRVQDEGEGILEENIPLIFEPFFTTKPIGSGTGLGLSISKNIIADHGGDIQVESTNENGSTFSIWLPAMKRSGEGAE